MQELIVDFIDVGVPAHSMRASIILTVRSWNEKREVFHKKFDMDRNNAPFKFTVPKEWKDNTITLSGILHKPLWGFNGPVAIDEVEIFDGRSKKYVIYPCIGDKICFYVEQAETG